MSKIYWDTMIFVYWLEEHQGYAKRISHILSKMEERQDRLYTSAFTAGEVLAGPYKSHNLTAAKQIHDFFESSFVEIIPYTLVTADFYARIRTTAGVSPADAIHLACAAQIGADLLLTNDAALVGKVVHGIQFIVGMDTNLF